MSLKWLPFPTSPRLGFKTHDGYEMVWDPNRGWSRFLHTSWSSNEYLIHHRSVDPRVH